MIKAKIIKLLKKRWCSNYYLITMCESSSADRELRFIRDDLKKYIRKFKLPRTSKLLERPNHTMREGRKITYLEWRLG